MPRFSIQEFLLPSSIINTRNPLFDRLLRRMPWPRGLSPENLDTAGAMQAAKIASLKRYTRRYAVLIPLILGAISAYLGYHDYNYYYRSFANSLWLIVFFCSLTFSLLCDLYYAMSAVISITQQTQQGKWDLLRLTRLSERDILWAHYTTIQIGAWRLTVLEIGLRSCLSVILVLGLILPTPGTSADFFLTLLVLIAILGGYILEPIWRMRTVTLIGMTITSWLKEYTAAIIGSFAALIGLIFLQIVVLGASAWLVGSVGSSRLFSETFKNYYSGSLGLTFLVIYAIGIMYLFFKGVQTGLFSLLRRIAFRK